MNERRRTLGEALVRAVANLTNKPSPDQHQVAGPGVNLLDNPGVTWPHREPAGIEHHGGLALPIRER